MKSIPRRLYQLSNGILWIGESDNYYGQQARYVADIPDKDDPRWAWGGQPLKEECFLVLRPFYRSGSLIVEVESAADLTESDGEVGDGVFTYVAWMPIAHLQWHDHTPSYPIN